MRRQESAVAVIERQVAQHKQATTSVKVGYALHRENQAQRSVHASVSDENKLAREIIENCIC